MNKSEFRVQQIGRRLPRNSVFVLLLSILSYLALYYFKPLDDNRFVSWPAVLRDVSVLRFSIAPIIGAVLAVVVSSISVRFSKTILLIFALIVSSMFYEMPQANIDSSRYFTQAKYLELHGAGYFIREWGRGIWNWTDLPAVPFLYGAVFRLFGESNYYILAFNAVLFSSTVLLVCNIGEELWDEETGFLGGLFILAIPFLYSQLPLMLVDVATMFFAVASAYYLLKSLRTGNPAYYFLTAFFVFLAVYSKYSLWPLLIQLPLIALVIYLEKGGIIIRRSLIVLLLCAIPIGMLFVYKQDVFLRQIAFLREFQLPGLKRWGESHLSTFFFQTHPFVTFFAMLSMAHAWIKRDLKFLIILWPVALIFIIGVKRMRYIIPMLPSLALMASYGLGILKTGQTRRLIAYTAAFTSIAFAFLFYLPYSNGLSAMNIKSAGRIIDQMPHEGVIVFTKYGMSEVNPSVVVPMLDLYTIKKIYYSVDESTVITPDDIMTSPTRFSWEWAVPKYYTMKSETNKDWLAAVIHDGSTSEEVLDEMFTDYVRIGEFTMEKDYYVMRTFVSLYQSKNCCL